MVNGNLGSAEIKKALACQRKQLKIRLWQERGEEQTHAGYTSRYPTCPYCGELIMHPIFCVMHEWLIKRNYLPVKLQYKIMVAENCVLAHNDCHDKHGQTVAFKMRCARAQYKRYGRAKIAAWVKSLALRQTIWVPTEEEAQQ